MPTEEIIVTITDLARGGAGVARDQSGRVIFVPFTAPGDRVRVSIVEQNKRYAQGRLLEIIEASPARQKAPCPYFGVCGGCQWQHLPYAIQWQTKAKGVRHALIRTGIEVPLAWEEFPAEKVFEYRNRVQLRGEGSRLGYYAAGSHTLVPIDRCPIARPEINAELEATRIEGARLPRPYKVEIDVLLTPEGPRVRKAWNASHGALGFRQVHDEQNDKLKDWIRKVIAPGRRLLDLYGGSGNLSVPLAGTMLEIECVDVSTPKEPPSGTPANIRFHRSEVGPWLSRQVSAIASGQDFGARPREGLPAAVSAILDPPREGLGPSGGEIVRDLEALGVREVIAVGCDVDAWVRDVGRFLRRKWKLERVAVLDFFPQTPHVESVALLRL